MFFWASQMKALKKGKRKRTTQRLKKKTRKEIARDSPTVLTQKAHTFVSRHEQLKWSRKWGIAEKFVTDGLGLVYTTCL